MKQFHSRLIRYLVAIMVAAILVGSLMISNVPTTYAATHQQTRSLNTQSASPHKLKPHVACYSGYPTTATSPSYTSTRGISLRFRVDWNCASLTLLTVTLYYGDGSYDNYSCWVNCVSGTTYYNHSYSSLGTFFASASIGYSPEVDYGVYVYIT